jgi:hypothetical protein
MAVSFDSCLLPDRDVCDGPIKSPTSVCDLRTSQKRLRPTMGCFDIWGGGEKAIIAAYIYIYKIGT